MNFDSFETYEDFEPAGLELPKIELEKKTLKKLGLEKKADSLEVLKALSRKGIKDRGIDKLSNKKEYYDRAKYEIDIFDELGFVDYILLNWDVVDFAKNSGIAVGDGRGSAAGSLILYLLGVTNKDPLPHDLFFERFVSKNRAKKTFDKKGKEFLVGSLAPDVDTDISHEDRFKVIDYIEEKHKGKTAKILTFNTFSSKLCIKECAKFFSNASEEEANKVSDMIPKEHGKVVSLKRAYDEVPRFEDWCNSNKKAYECALLLENLNKNCGVHPSGIAICSQEISDVCPLQLTKDGELISSYEMNDVADLMVKFDILGLRTLSIANKVCKKIGISLDDVDDEDPFIYEMLQDFNHPCGLFQISADINADVTKKVKPSNLAELADVVALARPAALQFVDDYISQKQNESPLGLHPELDKILARSKNVILYQEQLMQIANKVFKLSLDDAETLRRIVGKKKTNEMPAWRSKIFQAANENGLNEDLAQYYWNALEASANYSFNASHAVCYASLAAKTVWLKYKHPKEFFTSILEVAEDEPDPLEAIAEVSREISDFGVRLLPPSLESSAMNFTIEGDDIRYGLQSIKGVSERTKKCLEEFVKLDPKNKYEVFACAKQCKINIGVLSSMIYAGALGLKERPKKALEAQAYNLLTDREKRQFYKLGERHNFDLLNSISKSVFEKIIGDDNKLVMKESRFETFKRKFQDYKTLYQENQKRGNLSTWWFETNLLGYSPSLSLVDCFKEKRDLKTLKDISIEQPRSWRAVARIDDFTIRLDRNDRKYMAATVSDDSGTAKILFGDWRGDAFSRFLENGEPNKGDIAVIRAEISDGTNFVSTMSVLDSKVYLKTKELK